MVPGRVLHRLARRWCSSGACDRVIEPALADWQHEYALEGGWSRRIAALLSGYLTVSWSLVSCLSAEARSRESNRFYARAGGAFLMALGVTALGEYLAFHSSQTVHRLMMHVPYLNWMSLSTTATVQLGIPLATFPAVRHARARSGRIVPAAALVALVASTGLTVVADGWLGPAVARQRAVRMHEDFVRATGGRMYVDPLEWSLDRYPDSKSWPDLIRGALEPPKHRFPLCPRCVAAQDENLPSWHRQVILTRLFITALGILVPMFGYALGANGPRSRGVVVGCWLVLWAVALGGIWCARRLAVIALAVVLAATVAFRGDEGHARIT